jgi:glycosyltransferase involved in cell wall biosynthesis
MRIGLDCLTVNTVGGSQAIIDMVSNLLKKDKNNEYFVFGPIGLEKILKFSNLRVIATPLIKSSPILRFLYCEVALPLMAVAMKIDVFLVFTTAGIPLLPSKSVFFITALHRKKFKENYSFIERYIIGTLFSLSLRKAKIIIAPSEDTKKDLIKTYLVPQEKISVVYFAPRSLPTEISKDEKSKVIHELGINCPFILAVGNTYYKNTVRLIDAFEILTETNNQFHKFKLVITGTKSDGFLESFKKYNRKKIWRKVFFTGAISDFYLSALYELTDLMVFPSIYESFGYPPLEAMAHGAPVVASNITSVPELLGSSALLINPYDAQEIANGMKEALLDKTLRENLIIKGKKRVKNFTWATTSEQLKSIFIEAGQ